MLHRRIPALLSVLALAAACTEPRPGLPVPAPPPPPAETPPPPAPEPPREGILLSIYPVMHDRFALDAIAIVTPTGLRNPDEIEDVEAFRRRYIPLPARFPIRRYGVPAGEAAVVKALGPSCHERQGFAEVTPVPQGELAGLASDVFRGPGAAQPLMRAVTSAELAVLTTFVDSIYTARGLPREQRTEPRWEGLRAMTVPGSEGPVLSGTLIVHTPPSKFQRKSYGVMVIAERHGGRYHPAWVFHARDDRRVGIRSLLEMVDLEGDGVPELITRAATGLGDWFYTILRRGPDGWTEIYRGGGAQC